MICASCGHENRAGAKFCEECASPLAGRCAQCGTELRPSAKFCDECAAPVGAQPAADGAERSPRDYTPKHLADRILQSKAAIEGERKQVTVLFADLKGSMELAEQVDPEELHEIMDRFFEILAEGVHRFEGTINQYTGDGIMALFGAPIAHEDHAQRACYAALHLRGELERYATEVKREHGVGLSVRMGLNSGDVVVGKIGDDLRMDYTAQGHTVGLAQRMEALASPGTCYLAGGTAELATGYFELEDLGEFKVKGASQPVHVHRLDGVGAAQTRFDVSRQRGLTRFVGRDADVRLLDDALEQARAGNGQVVGVVAPAGTGKSRLCFEFVERCRADRFEVLEGRGVAHGKNIPFLPILEIFRAYFGVAGGDSDRAVREKVAGRLLLIDESLRGDLPVLFEFFGVADPDEPPLRLDPDARQRKLFGLMDRLAREDEGDEPRIYLVEDLHWIDGGSEAFLAQMVESTSGTRNLIVVNFRPEYHAAWMSRSWYRQLPLAPLGPEAIRELLADLLGDDPSTAGLGDSIHERTGGNPFFTEEIVQSLIESSHLEGTKGAYRLVTPVEELAVPATVHAVLAARIDRLAEAEKRVLQAAGVIGKDFPRPLLEPVVEVPSRELDASLAALKDAEFVYEQSLYPVAEYAFKHPLTQEVALASLLRERRQKLHRAVALAIEDERADALDENAALLAHHWEESGERLPAARWHRRAAVWTGSTDVLQSMGHWESVRKLVAKDATEDAVGLQLAACEGILSIGWRVGTELSEIYQEGRGIADQRGDAEQSAVLLQLYSRSVAGRGEIERYIGLTDESRRLALEVDDLAVRASAWTISVDAASWIGDTERALRLGDEYLATFPHDPSLGNDTLWRMSLYALIRLVRSSGGLIPAGRFEEANRDLTLSAEVAFEQKQPEVAGWAYPWMAEIAWLRGDAQAAEVAARRAAEAVEAAGGPATVRVFATQAAVHAHLAAGATKEAVAAARDMLAIYDEPVEIVHKPAAHLILARALLEDGRHDEAIPLAREAIRGAQAMPRRLIELRAQLVLAMALAREQGRSAEDEVRSALDAADRLLAVTGARAWAPIVHEARAEVAAAWGDDETRERELREALRLCGEFDCPGRAERIERELGT